MRLAVQLARNDDDPALRIDRRRRQTKQRTQADKRQHAVAQVHHAEQMLAGIGNGVDVIGQLHDLLDALDRQRIFLLVNFKRNEADLVRSVAGFAPVADRGGGRSDCSPRPRLVRAAARRQFGGVEDHHHAVGAFDDAPQQFGVDGRADTADAFHFAGIGGDDALHAIDDDADRLPRIHHHDTGVIVGRRLRHAENAPEADDRQHGAAQIGQPLQMPG